jgi:hypothetical protein
MATGEMSGSGNFVSVAPGVYSTSPPSAQVQQQPVPTSQPITTSADVLQVCALLCNDIGVSSMFA